MSKETILVIEDNTFNMKMVRTLLQFGDYYVLEASAAEAGIELARERLPDLILMDIILPDIDGAEAVKLLQENEATTKIPVLFLSGIVTRDDEKPQTEVSVGGRQYPAIPKPFSVEQLLEAVRELIL